MNLRDLRYIVSVAELGHFGKAALACHVSQPTLSGQILKLEEELGVTIFERVGKSIRTTAVGEQIIAHARRCLAAASDINASAKAHHDPLAGALRIGVIPTLAPYLMPYVLPHVTEKLPLAPLHLIEDLTGNLLPLLLDGALDGAIIATPSTHERLVEEMIFDEMFWLVMPKHHALAKHKTIAPSDIDASQLLLLAEGHCLRDQSIDLCGAGEPRPQHSDVRATSLETLLHLTAAGYGITLVPQLAVESWSALTTKLIARPLSGGQAARHVRLIYRRDMPRHTALNVLADVMRSALPRSVHIRPSADDQQA
jgi:LysR family hydrogen peroxide-inducible transcriptional activator